VITNQLLGGNTPTAKMLNTYSEGLANRTINTEYKNAENSNYANIV